MEWYRRGVVVMMKGSHIWNSFLKVRSWIFENLQWYFRMGDTILIGIDPILGV